MRLVARPQGSQPACYGGSWFLQRDAVEDTVEPKLRYQRRFKWPDRLSKVMTPGTVWPEVIGRAEVVISLYAKRLLGFNSNAQWLA